MLQFVLVRCYYDLVTAAVVVIIVVEVVEVVVVVLVVLYSLWKCSSGLLAVLTRPPLHSYTRTTIFIVQHN